MQITYIHQYFNTPAMPGSTRSYEMARRLVERGHEVRMITSDIRPSATHASRWYRTSEAGIEVHWLPVPYSNHMSYTRRTRAFARFAWAAARQAASLPGDVVFATSTPLTIALPGLYAARRLNVPMVFEVRDLWPELPIAMRALRNPCAIQAARYLERQAYHRSQHIVALSPDMQTGIERQGISPAKITMIPNACDFELFDVPREAGDAFRARHAWLGDRPLVVYIGTLGKINGVDYLARLAAEVRRHDPRVRFLVVGSGADEDKVRQTARQLGVLDETFYMLHRIPKQDVPGVLSAATIATSLFADVPAMWANSANKFFDGLAGGTPVAINYQGWQAALIRSRKIGLVLDEHDMSSSAATLMAALNQSGWAERVGRQAYSVGRELFDRNVLATRLEKVLLQATDVVSAPDDKDDLRLPAAA